MSQEKTEKPTPRRLRTAREQGQVARSRDLTGAVVLLVGALLLVYGGGTMARRLMVFSSETLSGIGQSQAVPVGVHLRAGMLVFWDLMAPFLVTLFAVSLLVSAIQVGGAVVSLRPLLPRLDRLHPGRGLRELWGPRRLVNLVKVMVVLLLVSLLSVIILVRHAGDLADLPLVAPPGGVRAIGWILWCWGKWILPVLLLLGLLDFAAQKAIHIKQLKMTREEVRREQREQEGDPVYRGERQRLHREMAHFDLAAAIKRATVLIVNPTRLACALYYDADTSEAPELVAKGRGHIAEQLRRLAQEYGVPVVEHATLARSLQELEVGQSIPPELYEAVAEILKFIWELEQSGGFGGS